MHQSTKRPAPLKRAFFSCASAAAMSAAFAATMSGPAIAQDYGDEEVVVVTGSRIARPANVTAPTSVTTINAETIEASGLTNVADILRTVPSFGVPGLSSTNSNFLTSGSGVNTLNLRNLGEDRTLVLVNGRRHVAGVPGSGAVDFNTIPVQMVDRVEVITGGSSAIYGSDAIGGVINVILKDDFEGVELGYQYGQSGEGDLKTHTPYIVAGTNFAGGRGNVTAMFSYDDNSGVFSRDRDRTAVDDAALCALTGDPADCFTEEVPFFSSFSEFGRFGIISTGDQFTVDPGAGPSGTLVPYDGSVYGFNRQAFRIISVPTERYLASLNAHYDLTDYMTAFVETTFARTNTVSELEPFPLAETDLGIPGISIDNPFMPAALRAEAVLAGDTEVTFARRLTEVDNRGSIGERDTVQSVIGLRGDANLWNWELFYSYGRVDQAEESTGSVNAVNFINALDAEDAGGGVIQCVDPAARAAGCVPINVFGFGSISPEAANYVRLPTTRNSVISQEIIGGSVGRPLFDLPAGSFDVVAGFEYRVEKARDVPDIFTQTGVSVGNIEPPTFGQFDVLEGFIEVEAPILRDAPFAEELTIGGAYRVSEYNTVGRTEAYTGRMSWSPVESLRFRAQYARAVRAANIGELFAPAGENFSPVTDPCDGVTATSTGAVDDNCRAVPVIAARIAATGSFTLTQPEQQGTGGFTGGGNPDLEPEVADSFNAGVVWDHNFGSHALLLSVDYYQIEIDGLIDTIDRQQSLDFCFGGDSFPNVFCDALVRDNAGPVFQQGELLEVNSGFINEGTLETSGIDVAASFVFDLESAGELALRANYTHLLEWTKTAFDAEDDRVGEVGYSEDKLQGGATYTIGPFKLDYELSWLSDARPDNDPTSPFYYEVGSYMIHDFRGGWDVNETINLYAGVNNAFDEEAPLVLTFVPGNITGTDTAADVYDPIGRTWYVGARARF